MNWRLPERSDLKRDGERTIFDARSPLGKDRLRTDTARSEDAIRVLQVA